MAKKCTEPGCKAYISEKVSEKWCIGHIAKYMPKEFARLRKEKKEARKGKVKKRVGNKMMETVIVPKGILSREGFDLEVEKELYNEESEFSRVDSNDPIELKLLKMKLFSRWLNAEEYSRQPQTWDGVSEVLDVSVRTLKYWRGTVELRKMMVDDLDDAMRYEGRKIAMEGFLGLLSAGDSTAVNRYMQIYGERSKEEAKDSDGPDWMKKKILELPEDTPADRKDKLILESHKEIAMKFVSNE